MQPELFCKGIIINIRYNCAHLILDIIVLTSHNFRRDGSLHIHVSEKSSGKSVGVTVEHG